ncbi:uncharacterized protein LOC134813721 [Bolinopsis microptera]|uniref:uncharacterized protein LOC134813721 n=1 Tax=Bolinopsis microptera TaxID=2820187 RepID=UPI0030798F12
MWLINNEKLTSQYNQKKQDMKDQGRTQQELKELFAFNLCSDFRLATNFCKYGMKAGNAFSGNHLGDCNMGVYFYRFIDTMKKYIGWMNKEFTGFLVIYKLMRGRVKNVTVHKETDSILEPDPNYDCHTSKYTLSQFHTMRYADAYISGRYYVYEFDDNLEIVGIPRQVVPYAIVEFRTKPDENQKERNHQPVMRSISELPSSKTPKENLEVIIDGVPLDAPLPAPEPEIAAKAGLLPTPTSVTPALLPTPDDPEKKISEKLDNLPARPDKPWTNPGDRTRRASSTHQFNADLKSELLEMQEKNLIWYPIITQNSNHWYTPSITPEALHKVMSCYARKKKEKLHETFVSLKINSRDHYYPCNFLQPIKFDNLGLRQKDILPQNIYHEVKETVEIYNIRKQPTYIGKISARGNFIVKSTLVSRGKFLSQVELAIHCNIKLPPINTVIDLTKNMSIKYAQTIYKKMKFSTPPVFNVNDRPIRMNGQIIVYSELRPINDIYDNCSHLQTFLYAKHLIAVAETPDCVIMITPNSPLTREWGVTCRKHPMQLHALISWKDAFFKSATSNSNSYHKEQGLINQRISDLVG